MEYLVGLIGILATLVGYLFISKKSAEALLQNTELKEKLVDLDKVRFQKEAERAAEEMKRLILQQNAEEKKNNPIDPKDFN